MDKFWIAHRSNGSNFTLHRHYEHIYQVLFMLNGKVRYVVGEKEYILQEGDAVVLSTLEDHSLEVLEYPYERIILQIDPTVFQHEIQKPDLISIFVQRTPDFSHKLTFNDSCRDRLYGILDEMLDEFQQREDNWDLLFEGDLRRLFVFLKRECQGHFTQSEHGAAAAVAYKVLHYLDGHYTEDLNIDKVAQAIFLNKHYISHAFHDELGYSIMNYVSMLRINRAKALLSQKNIGITEIAMECGYEDFAYFSRIFKKRTGMSPTAFRKSIQSDDHQIDHT